MDFISMDLIGEFYPASTRGNRYALTIICMLTGWVWCIPIPEKTANAILKVYLKNVHHVFGPSRKILSDNGTEFKNDLFDRVAKELGVEHKVYSPPTTLSQMVELRDSICFGRLAWQSTSVQGWNGMKSAQLRRQHITSYLMSMLERALSS